MFDDVRYGPDFEHFDYADPSAPRGGEIRLAALGTFDSLNPFILEGNAAAGPGLIYDNLLTGSPDEPFTEYGLLVESIDMPADRSWVEFTLREEARWHDGRHSDLAFDNPDFELLAKSFGAWGRTVTGPGQLLDALEEAFRQPGPALLAVPVDHAENVKLTQRLANLNVSI